MTTLTATSMKVLLLNNVPSPYFSPLFEQLGHTPDWQLTVCYTTNWNPTVGWKNNELIDQSTHRIVILDQIYPNTSKYLASSLSATIALKQFLGNEKPHYVICYGYTLMPQMLLLCWAILTKTNYALIGDANYFFDNPGGLRKVIKDYWLRFITKRAAALITIGTASKLFWEKYGASSSQIFESHLVVDNNFFSETSKSKSDEAADLRTRLGFNNKVVFLFVGRLIKRKNVDLIIQATHLLNSDNFSVVIAGSGDKTETLKRLAADKPNIFFAGNVTPNELPVLYGMADVLVLPADQEPWGLVVNEAMACGLAIIAYQFCGAAVDLVDSENGVKLNSFSAEELASAMELLATDQLLLRTMQKNSFAKIQAWSIENAAEGIIRAVKNTYHQPDKENS